LSLNRDAPFRGRDDRGPGDWRTPRCPAEGRIHPNRGVCRPTPENFCAQEGRHGLSKGAPAMLTLGKASGERLARRGANAPGGHTFPPMGFSNLRLSRPAVRKAGVGQLLGLVLDLASSHFAKRQILVQILAASQASQHLQTKGLSIAFLMVKTGVSYR
jgi:hypothetical protein